MPSSAPSPQQPVALITGGAQGIGRGIAYHLHTHGYAVVVADIDDEAGAECVQWGLNYTHTDMADEASVADCIAQTLVRHGRIDALVNNAGIADPASGPIETLTLERWNRVIGVNLTGCFLAVKHAAEALRATHGAVVNIASTRALQSEPDTEAYAASKGGLVALTHALAVSLGPDIRVNCISPGWIEVRDWQKASRMQTPHLTPEDHAQHPTGRVGRPADIAALAHFMLSAEAGFITGQNFVVDGGMTRKMIYREED